MEVSPGDICYPYSEDTEKIIDCAFRVANYLGNGFLEAVYQKCLEIELAGADIPFESQKELHIIYKGEDIGLTYRADIVVDKKIIIEAKGVKKYFSSRVSGRSRPWTVSPPRSIRVKWWSSWVPPVPANPPSCGA